MHAQSDTIPDHVKEVWDIRKNFLYVHKGTGTVSEQIKQTRRRER